MNTVLVAMSGGIDSLAVALLLQEQGCEVAGVTMQVWGSDRCAQAARQQAQTLGIPHYVVDERLPFRNTIVSYFINEYRAGRTPNPCALCNRLFKFRMLAQCADRLGCRCIATGHYARLLRSGSRLFIRQAADTAKDQSYFLWQLPQATLARCLFPLGNMRKTDVRRYLAQRGFTQMAQAPESMEVCFVEGDYRDFLRAQCPDIDRHPGAGLYIDTNNRPLGTHCGIPFYTVGQRKGLGIALGKPAYVVRLNPQDNTIVLGSAADLETEYMLVDNARFPDETLLDGDLAVRIRHRSRPLPCTLRPLGNGSWLVHFLEKASAVAPGQSAVFYRGEQMLGGAVISAAQPCPNGKE